MNGQDIPLPDPKATGFHTILGGKVSSGIEKHTDNRLHFHKEHGHLQIGKMFHEVGGAGQIMEEMTIPIHINIYLNIIQIKVVGFMVTHHILKIK